MISRELGIGLGVLAGVVLVGGVAYAASSKPAASTSSTTSSSSGSAGAAAPSSTLPAGAPAGLVSTSPTSTGWQVTVVLDPTTSGQAYPGLLGDQISVTLPAGAHWSSKTGVTSLGPATGTDPYVFSLIETQMGYQFTWTDSANTDHTTVVYFGDSGVTFTATTQLSTNDYVFLAITSKNLEQLVTSVAGWSTQASATAAQRQEAANLIALNAANASAMTEQQLLIGLLAMGPWAQSFAPDVRQIVPYAVGATLPSWAPSDDTGASTEAHVLYRYVGSGIDVSALPFPVSAWKRTA